MNLVQRIRTHLIDERIHNRVEANAEMELMTNVELVEVISFVLDDLLAGRPTLSPLGHGHGRRALRARLKRTKGQGGRARSAHRHRSGGGQPQPDRL
jgi:hypothetical protein